MEWRQIVDIAQVVGGIAGVIAIPVAIYLYRKSKRVARLALAFSQPSWLVNVERDAVGGDVGSAADRIAILYDGSPVPNAFIVQGRVINRGNIPLKQQDVHHPLTFSFAEGAQLLSAAIAGTDPGGLEADIEIINASSARLRLGLLNPDDAVLLTFVSAGQLKTPTPSARIEGVSRLEREPWGNQQPRGAGSGWVALFVLVIFVAFDAAILSAIKFLFPDSQMVLLVWLQAGLAMVFFKVIADPLSNGILRLIRTEYFES